MTFNFEKIEDYPSFEKIKKKPKKLQNSQGSNSKKRKPDYSEERKRKRG